ncbi:type II toxin-antitoxin system ParD family antitoxin [Mycolicibacterium sp. CBMA 226]|uniref:type II toxin-antitoxin system ParD family antitoxin n=1 Tax=Mycolicibacterium sp. CBMA 226 TaxID=2606611 RepID=UPI0013099CEF|nr:type II toxin-antitoxin system ParD family antitoxin [Mycolicibacterium sp. CBMA 226]MUL79016.1 type II toxin-antitoxin system ParD family antitoxin [Mycolicibacterium sp. CBMA 226]
MSRKTSFDLDDHSGAFIDGEVASGRYSSASDVVCSALRLLEERNTRVEALRQALIEGERSGTPIEFDFEQFLLQRRQIEESCHRDAR